MAGILAGSRFEVRVAARELNMAGTIVSIFFEEYRRGYERAAGTCRLLILGRFSWRSKRNWNLFNCRERQ